MKSRSAALRLLLFMLVALTAPAVPRAAIASSVTVPDDYATIQGAIDSSGADTILVRSGEYPEDLLLNHNVCLLAFQATTGFTSTLFDYPAVRKLSVISEPGMMSLVWIRGLHFRGRVFFDQVGLGSSSPHIVLEMCRMDMGLRAAMSFPVPFASFAVRGCVIFGGALVILNYADILNNAFIGGGLYVTGNGKMVVRGNYLEGPGDIGLTTCCSDGIPEVSDNVITGFRVGISALDGGQYLRNTVTNCVESGIEATRRSAGMVTISNNSVRRCGTYGIRVYGSNTSSAILFNVVDSVGAVGIRSEATPGSFALVRNDTVRVSGSHGISILADGAVSSNVVLRANGDGIIGATATADSNVVGHCTGAGIRSSGSEIKQNTVYLAASSGIVLSGGSGAQVQRNISYGSLAYGLDASGATAPVLGCNDWYANSLGATLGVSPAGTDLAVNPQFCNLAADDVTLASTSPLLAAPGCGLIGARGLGCTSPASVEAPSPARLGLTAGPVPASGSIRFRWGPGETASTLEVFDVLGARRFHADLPRGVSEFVWSAADDAGLALPAGVYFVRRVAGARSESTRVVIQR